MKKHLQSPDLQILLQFWQKDILTLDVLEKGQLIQLDNVTRIKLALRNPDQLAPFACYLVFKIGDFAINVTEMIWAKTFSVELWEAACNTRQFDLKKKYFNLTCLSLTNYLFFTIRSSLPKLKTVFFRSNLRHCVH